MEWFNYNESTGDLTVRFRRRVIVAQDENSNREVVQEEYLKVVHPNTHFTDEEIDVMNTRVRYLLGLPFVHINTSNLTLKDFDAEEWNGLK